MPARDSLFNSPLGDIESFRFNQAVVDVFPDMIRRSVPGYESVITQSALLASRYVQPGTHLYDLGSSLGATCIAMRDALNKANPELTKNCQIHAIDNSHDMVVASRQIIEQSADVDLSTMADAQASNLANARRANPHSANANSANANSASARRANPNSENPRRANARRANARRASAQASIPTGNQTSTDTGVPIIVHEDDLQTHPLTNASVVAMNFTLQFVDVKAREALMLKIANALQPGGVLILSEKICFDDPVINALHIERYHAFKSANGYSDLEISQKRTALENVLVPDTLSTHHQRLSKAGFTSSSVWFQFFNFASIIAVKA